ncbi:uncharacterized protein BDR25DRAFT_357244 [Lindgomyces ingoldianus]|uniref:Uncharacterized protein n=1 Tax=Lindgomyces ingoldianus TaxID=673940 RepID=A0ACB6QPQ3_9PLEO|nr:uncharacterized protein BDR25DRAFT_357244 [Lindgomyces ingoldianus]KAF2468886.1 hypothetical protein BDR25DRAFT_357244 [Lindgomyces ingoldianus]
MRLESDSQSFDLIREIPFDAYVNFNRHLYIQPILELYIHTSYPCTKAFLGIQRVSIAVADVLFSAQVDICDRRLKMASNPLEVRVNIALDELNRRTESSGYMMLNKKIGMALVSWVVAFLRCKGTKEFAEVVARRVPRPEAKFIPCVPGLLFNAVYPFPLLSTVTILHAQYTPNSQPCPLFLFNSVPRQLNTWEVINPQAVRSSVFCYQLSDHAPSHISPIATLPTTKILPPLTCLLLFYVKSKWHSKEFFLSTGAENKTPRDGQSNGEDGVVAVGSHARYVKELHAKGKFVAESGPNLALCPLEDVCESLIQH